MRVVRLVAPALMSLLIVAAWSAGVGPTTQASGSNLTFGGGNVETTTTVHLIFWLPSNSPQPPGDFVPTITQFFNDISGTGLYGILTQYTGNQNHPIRNVVNFGGAIRVTYPYPDLACGNAFFVNNCVGTSTIANLLKADIASAGWKQGLDQAFVVFTGPGEMVCDEFTCAESPCGVTGRPATHLTAMEQFIRSAVRHRST